MKVILALDQSTSATKAMLFSYQGELIDWVTINHRQIYPTPGWVEHDAQEIYENTIGAVRQLLGRYHGSPEDILCLSITNQRETVIAFDKQTGNPLHNAVVWQCRRGEPICHQLVEAGYGETVQKKTGLKIDTYFSASKMKWLLDNCENLRAALREGRLLFGTVDSYLIYRLTNHKVFATDPTNASRTLLYNIGTLNWDEELCRIFSVPMEVLPTVKESTDIFGETILEGLLANPIPICGVMGDSQGALFGQRCFTEGASKVTLGSGSSVMLNIGNSIKSSSNGIVTALGWVYKGQPTYAFEGIINYSGATIAWIQEQLKLIDNPAISEEMAQSVDSNDGVYFVPAFVGLGAPYWKPKAKAAIVGLTPSSNKNHIIRAALEAIAYMIEDVLSLMVADAGVDLKVIHSDGGIVKNKFLMQFIADIAQLKVRASTKPELSAFGAVLAGTLGMRVYHSLEELAQVPFEFIDYSPEMEQEVASKYYRGWKEAVGMTICNA